MLSLSVFVDELSSISADVAAPAVVFRVDDYPSLALRPRPFGSALKKGRTALPFRSGKACLISAHAPRPRTLQLLLVDLIEPPRGDGSGGGRGLLLGRASIALTTCEANEGFSNGELPLTDLAGCAVATLVLRVRLAAQDPTLTPLLDGQAAAEAPLLRPEEPPRRTETAAASSDSIWGAGSSSTAPPGDAASASCGSARVAVPSAATCPTAPAATDRPSAAMGPPGGATEPALHPTHAGVCGEGVDGPGWAHALPSPPAPAPPPPPAAAAAAAAAAATATTAPAGGPLKGPPPPPVRAAPALFYHNDPAAIAELEAATAAAKAAAIAAAAASSWGGSGAAVAPPQGESMAAAAAVRVAAAAVHEAASSAAADADAVWRRWSEAAESQAVGHDAAVTSSLPRPRLAAPGRGGLLHELRLELEHLCAPPPRPPALERIVADVASGIGGAADSRELLAAVVPEGGRPGQRIRVVTPSGRCGTAGKAVAPSYRVRVPPPPSPAPPHPCRQARRGCCARGADGRRQIRVPRPRCETQARSSLGGAPRRLRAPPFNRARPQHPL